MKKHEEKMLTLSRRVQADLPLSAAERSAWRQWIGIASASSSSSPAGKRQTPRTSSRPSRSRARRRHRQWHVPGWLSWWYAGHAVFPSFVDRAGCSATAVSFMAGFAVYAARRAVFLLSSDARTRTHLTSGSHFVRCLECLRARDLDSDFMENWCIQRSWFDSGCVRASFHGAFALFHAFSTSRWTSDPCAPRIRHWVSQGDGFTVFPYASQCLVSSGTCHASVSGVLRLLLLLVFSTLQVLIYGLLYLAVTCSVLFAGEVPDCGLF